MCATYFPGKVVGDGEGKPGSVRMVKISGYFLVYHVVALSVVAQMPGDSFSTITDDGAWTWYGDPKAFYYNGEYEKTYIVWINSHGDAEIGSFNHRSKETVQSVLHVNLQRDDHAHPSLLLRSDGRITAFYSAHNGAHLYFRTTVHPEDITQWSDEREVGVNSSGTKGYTYPNVVTLSEENNTVYLFWRGADWQPTFSTSTDGVNWTTARTLIQESGRPYVKMESNGHDEIHFVFERGHRRNENNFYYMCYRKSALYKADGTKIKSMDQLPVRAEEAEVLYDTQVEDVSASVWDIALDSRGFPVIVYVKFVDNSSDHRYYYLRWNGVSWLRHELTKGGGSMGGEAQFSGGLTLDHRNPSLVYLSRPVNGMFEIERWITADEGKTWSSTPVTAHSKNKNTRPCVPRNHPGGEAGLIWMYGSYDAYTSYNTGVKAAPTDILTASTPMRPLHGRILFHGSHDGIEGDRLTYMLNGRVIGRKRKRQRSITGMLPPVVFIVYP
jgi:hypothetical protein